MAHLDREHLAYFLSKLQLWVASYAPSKDAATPYSPGLMSAADKAKLDGIFIDDALNAASANPVQNRAIAAALQGLREDLDELDARTSSVYTYKGSVPTKADLPSSGNQTGDVWDVTTAPDDGSWVWDGSQWNKMSGIVDLSGLATKDVATPSSDGLMSAADKASFDALMQGFVPLWSSLSNYSEGMLIRGSDGELYFSQQSSGPAGASGARNPVGDDGTYWTQVSTDGSLFVHLSGDETVAGSKTFSSPVVGDVLTSASGATEARLLSDRAAESVNLLDFGAAGDGTTDDSSAFSALEAAFSGRQVDLLGKTYNVGNVRPSGNYYVNGYFVVKGRTIPAYETAGCGVYASWRPGEFVSYADDNNYLSYFICNGSATPSDIANSFAPTGISRLKGVIAIGSRAAHYPVKNNVYAADLVAIGSNAIGGGVGTADAEHNIAIGGSALYSLTSGHRNTAIGSLALFGVTSGHQNIAVGRDAAQCLTTGSNNVVIGYRAWGEQAHIGIHGRIHNDVPRTDEGFIIIGTATAACFGANHESYNVTIIGHNAANNMKEMKRGVLIGSNVCKQVLVDYSYYVKDLVRVDVQASYTASGSTIVVTDPNHSAVVGRYVVLTFTSGPCSEKTNESQLMTVTATTATTFTLTHDMGIFSGSGSCNVSQYEQNTGPSYSGYALTVVGSDSVVYGRYLSNLTVVGTQSLTRTDLDTADYGVHIGDHVSDDVTYTGSAVVIGNNAGCHGQCLHNTFVGRNAGNVLNGSTVDAYGNTALGYRALYAMYDGSERGAFKNSTALGQSSCVSGSWQVQLGGSGTTPYAYAALQIRSDARDKTDVRDTELGLAFIEELRPVDFRWDVRDDYVAFEDYEETVAGEDGHPETVQKTRVRRLPKDGSKKRVRFHHGFIAQDVKAALDRMGIDFGGYQDHKVNGGGDVLSLGYEEFIGPLVKAVQELSARVRALEERHGS